MNDAIKRALERMREAAGKAEREGDAQRSQSFFERAERCEGQAHGLRAASRMLEEELAKVIDRQRVKWSDESDPGFVAATERLMGSGDKQS